MNRRTFMKSTGSIAAGTTVILAGCSGETEESSTKVTQDVSSGSKSGNGKSTKTAKSAKNTKQKSTQKQESKSALTILDHSFEEGDFSSKVVGTLKNTSGKEQGYVQVQATFQDSDGNRIGKWMDNTTELPAGSTWEFEIMYTGDDTVDSYTLETGTSPF